MQGLITNIKYRITTLRRLCPPVHVLDASTRGPSRREIQERCGGGSTHDTQQRPATRTRLPYLLDSDKQSAAATVPLKPTAVSQRANLGFFASTSVSRLISIKRTAGLCLLQGACTSWWRKQCIRRQGPRRTESTK